MDDSKEQEVSISSAGSEEPIYTVGHSVLSIDDFVALLDRHAIAQLLDVRRYPGSRRHPQFGSEALSAALRDRGIGYGHLPDLGGRRRAAADSRQIGWRNASFRGYADYMQTEPFDRALRLLRARARDARTAIMCAEALPWRCHRSLIADALVARGMTVFHIMHEGIRKHALPPFARVRGVRVEYPGGAQEHGSPDLFAS
jgi:uncharacterized protein (DUF488 family)